MQNADADANNDRKQEITPKKPMKSSQNLEVAKQTPFNKRIRRRKIQHRFRSVAVTSNQPMASSQYILHIIEVRGACEEAI